MNVRPNPKIASYLVIAWMIAVAMPQVARPQTDNVAILTIPDTTVSPEDSVYGLSFYLANPVSAVGGFDLTFSLNRSDLMEFVYYPSLDTFITCNGEVCDTTISTINRVDMGVAGSPVQFWELVQGRAPSPYSLKAVAIADLPFKPGTPAPVPPSDTPAFLFRVELKRTAEPWYLDTATERSVVCWMNPYFSYFTGPMGQSVPLPDSEVCLDPPACTVLDTVPIASEGTITIAMGCTMWGDVNRDNVITSADIIALVSYVFKGGPEPGCSPDVGDANCDGSVTSADIIFLVVHVFKGGPAPCVP